MILETAVEMNKRTGGNRENIERERVWLDRVPVWLSPLECVSSATHSSFFYNFWSLRFLGYLLLKATAIHFYVERPGIHARIGWQ
jgi:hypothetical protein